MDLLIFARKGQKAILTVAILVVFSLVASSSAEAKKQGAELFIKKKDGQEIKGWLLAIKEGRLILLDSLLRSEVTIEIEEVTSIKMLRKARIWQGLGLGLLGDGFASSKLDSSRFGYFWSVAGIIFGWAMGIDEFIDLEGMSAEETKRILIKLDKMSRSPQSGSPDLGEPIPSLMKMGESTGKKSSAKFSRFHLTFRPGYFHCRGANDVVGLFERIGFGDTRPAYDFNFFGIFSGRVPAKDFPQYDKNRNFHFRDIMAEYSFSRNFAVGIGYSLLEEHKIEGFKLISVEMGGSQYWSELYLTGNYSGDLYYLTGSWMPVADAFLKKSSLKLGGGVGWSNLRLKYETTGDPGDHISFSKKAMVVMGFAEFNYYFNRHTSIGVRAEYRHAFPLKVKSFQLIGSYLDVDENDNYIYTSMPVIVPEHNVNVGGFGLGINFGFHF